MHLDLSLPNTFRESATPIDLRLFFSLLLLPFC